MTYYNSIFIFSLCDFSLSSCLLNTHNCCFRSQLAVSDEWHRAVHLSIIHCSFLTCLNGFVFFLFFTCPAAIDAILSKWVIKRIVDASQWWSRGADCDIVYGGAGNNLILSQWHRGYPGIFKRTLFSCAVVVCLIDFPRLWRGRSVICVIAAALSLS